MIKQKYMAVCATLTNINVFRPGIPCLGYYERDTHILPCWGFALLQTPETLKRNQYTFNTLIT